MTVGNKNLHIVCRRTPALLVPSGHRQGAPGNLRLAVDMVAPYSLLVPSYQAVATPGSFGQLLCRLVSVLMTVMVVSPTLMVSTARSRAYRYTLRRSQAGIHVPVWQSGGTFNLAVK